MYLCGVKISMTQKISAVIITFNEERNIARCLQSLQDVVDEVVVVDSGSIDRTEGICKQFGARFIPHKWEGYGRQKNFALSQASNNWVLSIDADEQLTPELANEIKSIFSQDAIPFAGYYLPITLVFLGKKFKYGNENKQQHLRLFNKAAGQFINVEVHEKVEVHGKTATLKAGVLHHSYQNIEHLLHKLNSYSSIAAKADANKGKKTRKWHVGFDLLVRFFTIYIIRLNFLNGYEGFVWSVISAYSKFVRSCKQIEIIYEELP